MATFSANGTNQLYVGKSLETTITSATAVGGIKPVGKDGKLYFQYQTPDGATRTDLIPIADATLGKATRYDAMQRGLAKYSIALDSNINSGAPIAGQDYITRITYYEWGSPSQENQFYKFGAVRGTTGMTAEQFYIAMKNNLVAQFAREKVPTLTFSLDGTYATKAMTTNTGVTITANAVGTAGNAITFAVASVSAGAAAVTVTGTAISVSLTAAAKTIADLKAAVLADATASALVTITGTDATAVAAEATPVTLAGGTTTGVILEEIEQPWRLGIKSSDKLMFAIHTAPITANGDYIPWGVVTQETSTTFIQNGKLTADREYFYMGERGDIYRGMGYPNTIATSLLVDSTLAYNFIDITYKFIGTGVDPQASEKVITIVVPAVGSGISGKVALANTIITAINTAYGSTLVATLATS